MLSSSGEGWCHRGAADPAWWWQTWSPDGQTETLQRCGQACHRLIQVSIEPPLWCLYSVNRDFSTGFNRQYVYTRTNILLSLFQTRVIDFAVSISNGDKYSINFPVCMQLCGYSHYCNTKQLVWIDFRSFSPATLENCSHVALVVSPLPMFYNFGKIV